MTASHSRFRAVYLRDHHAAATAGLALAQRTHGSNARSELGGVLAQLVDDLRADKEFLESLMARHGVTPNRMKVVGALAGERVGRLKLNGQLRGYSPLARLVELEGLRAGIYAKRAMWEALRRVDAAPGDELDAALERADDQLARLEPWRRHAATIAFVPEGAPGPVPR